MNIPSIAQSQLDVRPLKVSPATERYMNPGELQVLVALARMVQPEVICEFGVNEGRTAKVLLDNVDSVRRYHGWDVFQGYKFDCKVQRNEVPALPGRYAASDPRFTLHLNARGTFSESKAALRYADFIFIDGDHSRDAVMHDSELALSMLRPGGMIVWHDYHDQGTVDVRDVLDGMYAGGWADLQHVENTWLVFSRP